MCLVDNKKIVTFELKKLKTSIRDFNGMKIALYQTEDGGSAVISCSPNGDWKFSESVTVADVLRSPPWIDEDKIIK